MSDTSNDTISILHVDDEPEFAELTATFLERENSRFAVETTTSASAALEWMDRQLPDCVVSDYDMPGQNGIEFLETVRQDHPELPFVLYTGNGSEAVASEAVTAGVSDYLQKDTGSEQYKLLAKRIENVVAQFRAQEKLRGQRRQLEQLHRATRDLMAATTRAEIAERASATAQEVLDLPLNGIHLYDPEQNELVPVAVTDAVHETIGDPPVISPDEAVSWTAYETGEPQVYDDIREAPDVMNPETELRSEFHIPLGEHGVLVAGSTESGDFTEADITSARILASNVEAALDRAEREQQRRQNERRYQTIFDDPNILIGLLDTDGTFLEVNQTALSYIASPQEEVIGEPLWETPWVVSSSDAQQDVETLVSRAANGEYVEVDLDPVTSSGDPYTLEGIIRPVMDNDETVVSLLVSTRDVTDRRQRERELERTNALLSTLFDTLPQGVLATDGSGDIVAVNQEMLDLLDHHGLPEAAVGTDGRDLLSEASRLFADPERFVERINRQVDAREPVDSEEMILEDGRAIEWSYRPVERLDGDGHLWVYDDVTERINYHNRVQELQHRTERLITSRDESEIASTAVEIAEETLEFPLSGVHLVDETGERLEPVAVTDGVRDHLDRVPTYEQTTPSRRTDEFNWRVFEQGEPAVVEDIHDHDELSASETPTRSGIVYPLGDHGIFITSSPLPSNFDENDVNLVEILATLVTALLDRARRETELREQKRLLKRKTERLDEFASVVSHDLRNPLTVASGSLEIARKETDSEALDRVNSALDRIDTLLTDLRTLAREGKTVTDREAVDLVSLVWNCWQNVETADATLVAEVDRTVRADRSRLKEVFENLYRNGVTHGGSDVTVTIGELEDGFYVADDGPGIPADEREAVFESGYSTSTEGIGVGLSIVAEIVEAHGWRISATRSTSGGARFEITGVEFADSTQ
jgi:PAS domain S-box-containing protein